MYFAHNFRLGIVPDIFEGHMGTVRGKFQRNGFKVSEKCRNCNSDSDYRRTPEAAFPGSIGGGGERR